MAKSGVRSAPFPRSGGPSRSHGSVIELITRFVRHRKLLVLGLLLFAVTWIVSLTFRRACPAALPQSPSTANVVSPIAMLPSLSSSLCRALALFWTVTTASGQAASSAPTRSNSSHASTEINGVPFPPLIDADLEDIAGGLEAGLFTSVDLVNAYIARIQEVNSTLKAVTQINPDALSIAAELDTARAQGNTRGPLHGIPILIKNNIASNDKLENTAGSYALLGAKVPEDSTVVAKLRKAGAVLLGKTNLSQWANYRSENSSSGWSAYGGQTEAAYYPAQNPSGSSSGSGVAGSLALSLATLGTETDGSIVSPSERNNLVGIKPSVGLTSRHLVVPISEHQDTVGPMARSVKDAAYLLSAIAGPDEKDNYTSAIPFDHIPDYVAACDYFALQGKRIGVARNLINLEGAEYLAPILPVFDAALDTLRAAGAVIVDNITLPGVDSADKAGYETNVLDSDFITDFAKYMSQLSVNPHNITSVADLLAFTHALPAEDWPRRDTLIWEEALALGHGNDSPEFWANYTLQLRDAGPRGIPGALANHSLDALVAPTVFASAPAARLGSPIVTVPLGRFPDDAPVTATEFGGLQETAPNVPFGISFLAERFSEERLIGFAYAFEQRTLVRGRVEPYLQPRTELAEVVEKRKGEEVRS